MEKQRALNFIAAEKIYPQSIRTSTKKFWCGGGFAHSLSFQLSSRDRHERLSFLVGSWLCCRYWPTEALSVVANGMKVFRKCESWIFECKGSISRDNCYLSKCEGSFVKKEFWRYAMVGAVGIATVAIGHNHGRVSVSRIEITGNDVKILTISLSTARHKSVLVSILNDSINRYYHAVEVRTRRCCRGSQSLPYHTIMECVDTLSTTHTSPGC